MKDGSFDIPSLNFKIIYKDQDALSRYDIMFMNGRNKESIRKVRFEQVDGLTVGDVLSFFKTKGFLLVAEIDRTDERSTQKNYKSVLSLNFLVEEKDLNEEISKYIEEKLIEAYCNNSIGNFYHGLTKAAILTFCKRYRRKPNEEIEAIQKKLKYEVKDQNEFCL